MKRYLYVLFVFLVLAVIGFGLYVLLQYLYPSPLTPTGGAIPPLTNLPQSGMATSSPANIFLAYPDQIFDYAPINANSFIVILPDGTMKETTIGSELKKDVTQNPIANMAGVFPSHDGTKLLVSFGATPTAPPQFSIYDIASGSWLPLSPGVTSAAWSPVDSSHIAYLKEGSGTTTIGALTLKAASSTSASAASFSFADKPLATFSVTDFIVRWVNADSLFLASKPTSKATGDILMFSIAKKTISRVASGAGLTSQWSMDGDYGILYSADTKVLILTDNFAQPLLTLPFVTLPDKCVIQSRLLYCAVPRESLTGIDLPDAYYQGDVQFRDDIYGIDLKTGKSTLLFSGAQFAIDAIHLQQSADYLFFKNTLDEKMYAIHLPNEFIPAGQ